MGLGFSENRKEDPMDKVMNFVERNRKKVVFVGALTVLVSSAILLHYSTNPLATVIAMGTFIIGAGVSVVTASMEVDG